jgi:hypothetical protein
MLLDYFVLVFFAAVGVFQIVAVRVGLRGLCFFGHPIVQSFFGAAAIVAAFAWFYTKEERNVQHTVEGAQQLVFFLAAAILAYLVTAGLASIINARGLSAPGDSSRQGPSDLGIAELKGATLFQAIVARRRKSGRSED